jgi:hypothetical protein
MGEGEYKDQRPGERTVSAEVQPKQQQRRNNSPNANNVEVDKFPCQLTHERAAAWHAT